MHSLVEAGPEQPVRGILLREGCNGTNRACFRPRWAAWDGLEGVLWAPGDALDPVRVSLRDNQDKPALQGLRSPPDETNQFTRITTGMDGGNKIREEAGRGDVLALAVLSRIQEARKTYVLS